MGILIAQFTIARPAKRLAKIANQIAGPSVGTIVVILAFNRIYDTVTGSQITMSSSRAAEFSAPALSVDLTIKTCRARVYR